MAILEDIIDGSGVGDLIMMFMSVFWILILIGGFILLFKLFTTSPEAAQHSALPRGGSSIDILKERYARGKIGREEFERMKRDLSES